MNTREDTSRPEGRSLLEAAIAAGFNPEAVDTMPRALLEAVIASGRDPHSIHSIPHDVFAYAPDLRKAVLNAGHVEVVDIMPRITAPGVVSRVVEESIL